MMKRKKYYSRNDKFLQAAVDLQKKFTLSRISGSKIKRSKKKYQMTCINCIKDEGIYMNKNGVTMIKESTLIKNSNNEVLAFVYVGGKDNLVDGGDMLQLKKGSNNLVTSSHGHHTISGESYGFGISKRYRIDKNGNSFGEYACKSGVSDEQQLEYAKPTIQSIQHCVHILEKYLGEPFMKNAFSVVDGMNKVTSYHKMKINKKPWVDNYFVNFILNIDIETEYHTDDDAAYTVLSSSNCKGKAVFNFKNICKVPFCNDKLVIIFYAATQIEHCQKILQKGFINSGSYVQQKLMNHIYKSVERNMEDKRSIKKIKKIVI
jgi:hypothetical protein